MSVHIPDFEPDADFSAAGDLPLGFERIETEDGDVLVNAQKADEFDPRHANDVEGLLFLGYLTDEFELFGHTFIIRTLRRGERLACALVVKEWEETLGIGDALETAYVSASLMSVDGRALTAPLGPSENPIVRIRSNFGQVSKWYDYVVESIYQRYSALLVRQHAAFTELEGKSTASRPTP